MSALTLPGFGRNTTPFGMGSSALTGGWGSRDSIRLVHAAYDAGVRHFDVAPPYGMGTAEDVIGEALSDRRNQVTLATKVGIARPLRGTAILLARALAAPLRKRAPALTRSVGAKTYRATAAPGQFDPAFVEASLHESLRRLRTDRLDTYLLHEVAVDNLTDELMSLLTRKQRDGVIGAIGTATSYEQTLAIQASFPQAFSIWQYSWSAIDLEQQRPLPFTIVHRAIQRAARPLAARWLANPAERTAFSAAIGVDLGDPAVLARTLLGAARAHNRDGIVLFASRTEARIRDNVATLSDASLAVAGAALVRFLNEPASLNR